MREVEIVGVRVEMPSNEPIVLLREPGTDRYLPIWVGAAEASAIAFAQQGLEPPRPLTHDLMTDLIAKVGYRVREVKITALNDGVFDAILVLEATHGDQPVLEVPARPSDALALAIRASSRVLCAETVLEEAAVRSPSTEVDDSAFSSADEPEAEQEVERFREFLDQISPEDFE